MALRPVDEVVEHLLGKVQRDIAGRPPATETRILADALDCCLAEDIVSPVNVPPEDNSAMDGYALAFDAIKTLEDVFPVSARIPAGSVGSTLQTGTVARIFTGAEIPNGADTVVMQENTETLGDAIRIVQRPARADNVRSKGQDIRSGTTILSAGARLSPRALSLIASVGIAEVRVYTPLRIAILSTGDELVEPGGQLKPGQIFNSNRYALAGLIRKLGMLPIDLGIVADSPEATDQALTRAAAEADCIVTSGGVSVGEEDHVKASVERLGSIDLWSLAIKPGKPLAYGEVRGTPFFGLPGNPVSTFVTFTIVARPYLLALQGLTDVSHHVVAGVSNFSFKGGGRREYVRVRTELKDGQLFVEKFPHQGSGIMTSVVWADALAEIDIGQDVVPGDPLKLFPLADG